MNETVQAVFYLVGAGGAGAIIKTVFDYLTNSKQTAAKVQFEKLKQEREADRELITAYQTEIRRLSSDRNRLLDMVVDSARKTEIAATLTREVVDSATQETRKE